MLWRLLRTYLAPFRGQLAVLIGFQLASTITTLLLPSIYGDIIDRGVDDRRHRPRPPATAEGHAGESPPASSPARLVAVYFGARVAMALGWTSASAIFHHVEPG